MKALRYTKRLVSFDSTSHKSNRLISKYLEMKLTKHGFVVEKVKYKDREGVTKVNVIAKKGSGHGGLAYFSHSDVVPVKKWFTKKFGPFEATVGKQRLYGRGACDMKGSIACMLAAAQQFSRDDLKAPLYFVCTADEEVGFHGARAVVEDSKTYREMVSHATKAIIGEPTSLEVVHAHKGSYEIVAKSKGVAAHSSTREGLNANLAMIPFLTEMKLIHDETEQNAQFKNSLFQPSTVSWNIGIKDDAQAINITAASSTCTVYLRPMPEVDLTSLLERVIQCGADNGLDVQVNKWAEPFYTEPNTDFIEQSVKLANRPKPRTVSYGTDGGIFTELGDKIVFGPGSIDQAHTNNEWIALEQLKLGTELYCKMIQHWCCQ